MSKRMVIVVK